MDISNEGLGLIARAALMTMLIIVGAVFRALVGSSRKRHEVMLIGTIAGLSAGVAVSKLLARWTTTDVSVICACAGMIIGWNAAWLIARRVARDPN
jgi:glycopeptide antibiotics resistance protein